MDKDVSSNLPQRLDDVKGIIYLGGLVFLDKTIIKTDDPIVKHTFQDVFKYVCYN